MSRFGALVVVVACICVAYAGIAAQDRAQAPRDLKLAPAKPESASRVPRGYALIIGISTYPNLDAARQLRYAESDAEAMYRVLISKQGGAFPADNVKLLKGRDATLANIRYHLEEWLPAVAAPDDRVVVYFAGHGFVNEGKGFLAPADVNPERLEETGYLMTMLGDVMSRRIKAQWKVLLTDACHSGKINAETTSEVLERHFNALPSNFLTLTATSDREQSFEDQNLSTGFGFYTYFLVRAFQGDADNDPCDGRITADELIVYVRTNVRRYARERQLSQTPTARGDYEPDMLLGIGADCLTSQSAPSTLGTAIVETNLDDVALYVDGMLIGRLFRDKPLTVPSLSSGVHEFKGVKAGYQPDTKEVLIAPGQKTTVTLRIRYARQVKKAAVDLNAQGERLLYTRRSSTSVLNAVPIQRAQTQRELERAVDLFERALGEDASFGLAAYNLGQAYHLLLKYDQSLRSFRLASQIDSGHLEARVQTAAVLIERGDPDEAVRELTEVLRLEPGNDDARSMLARAFWDKGAWGYAIEQADLAIGINDQNAQAHLWKADSMRQLAAAEDDSGRRQQLYSAAREDYREFLRLTNFSSGLVPRLAFHFLGFGVGSRRHADREGAYDSLRSAGFLGLCLSEQKVGNPLRAREYCGRALKHAPNDPIAHFLLGNVNRDIYNVRQSCGDLLAARKSYTTMIGINPDLDESRNAKNYIGQIETILPKLGCRL